MASKPMPKLGQTKAIMDEFVRTGKVPANTESEAAAEAPSYEPRSEPMHRPMRRPMNMHASLYEDSALCGSVSRRRAQVVEPLVQRGYSIPQSLADRVRIIAASEGITCTEIVTEALAAWVGEYNKRFNGEQR